MIHLDVRSSLGTAKMIAYLICGVPIAIRFALKTAMRKDAIKSLDIASAIVRTQPLGEKNVMQHAMDNATNRDAAKQADYVLDNALTTLNIGVKVVKKFT